MAKRKRTTRRRKKPKCSEKSFSCGFSCQPRMRNGKKTTCSSNVDEKGNKLVETYAQFLGRTSTKKTKSNNTSSKKGSTLPSQESLDKAKLKSFGRGDTANADAIFETTIKGKKFFVKANVSSIENQAEVTAKKAADLLGVGKFYLPIERRKIKIPQEEEKVEALISPLIAGKALDQASEAEKKQALDKTKQEDLENLLMTDYLLLQGDRNSGNLFLTSEGLTVIDNGVSLHSADEAKDNPLMANSEINKNVIRGLAGLSGFDSFKPIDPKIKEGFLSKKEDLLNLLKKEGMKDTKAVEQRFEQLERASMWGHILGDDT